MKRLFLAGLVLMGLIFLMLGLVSPASAAEWYDVYVLWVHPQAQIYAVERDGPHKGTWVTLNLVDGGGGHLGPWPWCCMDPNTPILVYHTQLLAAAITPNAGYLDWEGLLTVVDHSANIEIVGPFSDGSYVVIGDSGKSVSVPGLGISGDPRAVSDLVDVATQVTQQGGFQCCGDPLGAMGESLGDPAPGDYAGSGDQNSNGAEYE